MHVAEHFDGSYCVNKDMTRTETEVQIGYRHEHTSQNTTHRKNPQLKSEDIKDPS